MYFFAECSYQGEVMAEELLEVGSLPAAKQEVLRTLTEMIRIGFDGFGRTASARILDGERRLATTLSLTLDVQEG